MARQPAANRIKAKPVALRRVERSRWQVTANLRAWREQHAYSFFSSLERLRARPFASALTALIIGLALALPLLFFLVLDNAKALSAPWRESRDISVFLKPKLDAKAVNDVIARLRQRDDIAAIAVKTPEQGLAEFRNQSGFAQALQLLPYNPLPTVLIVTPSAQLDTASEEPALIAALKGDPQVDIVQYDAAWSRRLAAILGLVERAVFVLAMLLAFGALLVVGNSIRLDIQARSEEIAIAQLFGANKAFVRRPFLYTGLWYGLLGGIVACLLVALVQWSLAGAMARLLASYDHRFALNGLDGMIVLSLLGLSALLGWLGAGFAASRHLAQGPST